MTARRSRSAALSALSAAALVLAALIAAACGPYAEVAQKLDVTKPFADAETWVAASGTEVRLLLLGGPRSGAPRSFAFTALETPLSAGVSASALQGEWDEDARSTSATFTARTEYLLPDERGTSVLARVGATRRDVNRTMQAGFARAGDRLVVTGAPEIDGSYRRLPDAMARLGASTERDASCAFQVVNLAIRSAHVRIIGFGGPGMTQYQNPATFAATIDGSFHVEMEGFLHNRTTIRFDALVELGGIRVDGPQITEADSAGDGHMSGALAFVLEPRGPDGAASPEISGTLDYAGGGDPADAVQIRGGTAVGGHYTMSLEGGGLARVSPETFPAPSVADCLALP
ncbi:MAG TPA: hypothetical protein VFK85_11605 [Anaeromyxobacteraceae bacterium]|nr:hypothetical protein [Anaeromyxobacteraceae bacterium]